MNFRFAIGHPGGQQSSSWKLWGQGDEAYLLQRGVISQHVKFSFHRSGNCRWAMIQRGVSGAHRAILEWQRNAVPPKGSGQGSLLLSLAFPTNHLSAPQAIEERQTRWINPAPIGQGILIEIFVAYEEKAVIEQLSAGGPRHLLYFHKLRNSLGLCAVTSQFNCGPINISMPAALGTGSVFGEMNFPDYDECSTNRPVRIVIMQGKNLPPVVWELGGYEVAKINLKPP